MRYAGLGYSSERNFYQGRFWAFRSICSILNTMQRKHSLVRGGWEKKVEDIGLLFHHTTEGLYWDESAYYSFDYRQIAVLEKATSKLNKMCLRAVGYIIENKQYDKLSIPAAFIPFIENSWHTEHPSVYGRFDLCYDGINPPKLLEFNADTPTSLFEASIVQWFWLREAHPKCDQFNSIHEKLIKRWRYLSKYYHYDNLYFACLKDNIEDFVNTEYLRDCAMQAGLETGFIYIEDIGYDTKNESFVDLEGKIIGNIFKLYPWEWMVNEEFGPKLLTSRYSTFWTEPAWKMLLSNKGILPILWQLFPGNENLLPAYFEEDVKASHITDYVKKPKLSREGANIEIYSGNNLVAESIGDYGEEGYIYQEFSALPDFDGFHPVIGSWLIGYHPAGIGIRESKSLITDNMSRFVPHLIR